MPVFDVSGVEVVRAVTDFDMKSDASAKAGYKYDILKVIFEQLEAIRRTMGSVYSWVKLVWMLSMQACYWIEQHVGTRWSMEIAFEFRYRQSVVHDRS